jgi:serine/threonine protein kinase/tetratricopeptide (TPR) repeat protein
VIGRTLGQFQVVEELGAGGMGVVYRAHDERLRRDVALKFLPRGAFAGGQMRRSFHREALALSRLNHPGIATVHDFQTIDDLDFLVMEYIPGESLEERIQRGPVPESELVAIGVQLAEGLAEAHRCGVIHRDLKPGNLRITPEGRLKILDFGLAKWLGPDSEVQSTLSSSTDSRGVAGTPAYLAPELLSGTPASERSDLYCAGLVLYEGATGQRPFHGLPVGVLIETIRHQSPPTPRSLNPALSTGLESIIMKCTEKRPERRFGSANELAHALRQHGGLSPRGPSIVARRRAPKALWAGLAVLLVGIFLLAWQMSREARSPAASIRSLAVLPLGNLSGDPEQEYFALGMTEELIAQLSHVRAIRVTSLTSVRRYGNSKRSMPEIARELGVDGVIEGNVIKYRDRLRTTVHLIDARDDAQLWSGEYDGDTTDALALQSRMARAIVNEIRVRLSPEERSHLATPRHVDPVAHQLYLRGRYQWNRRTDAGIRLAIDYFQRAVARDSLYALAYSGLADAWAEAALYGFLRPLEARERARTEALRAVALDPDLAEGHTSLAHVLHNFDWDWNGADREYRRAIELSPSNALAHGWRAHLLAQRGAFDQARRELREAQSLDPLSLQIALAEGVFEYYARRYDSALEALQRAAELDSSSALLHRAKAAILDRQGHERQAIGELARSFALQGQPEAGVAVTRAYEATGLKGAVDVVITGLLRKRAAGLYEPAEHIAELYARTGRTEQALEWLETAYREHDTELNRLRIDPIFDPLRSDPRFAALLHRIGLDAPPPRS